VISYRREDAAKERRLRETGVVSARRVEKEPQTADTERKNRVNAPVEGAELPRGIEPRVGEPPVATEELCTTKSGQWAILLVSVTCLRTPKPRRNRTSFQHQRRIRLRVLLGKVELGVRLERAPVIARTDRTVDTEEKW